MHTTSHRYSTKTNRRTRVAHDPRPTWRPQASTLTRDELKKIVLEMLG